MLLTLLGCGWIGDLRLEERLDQDGDGFVLGTDCDDSAQDIRTLDDIGPEAELGCGETVALTFGTGIPNDDQLPIDAEDPAVVLPCADPLDPDRYLPPLYHQRLVRVRVDRATDVRVRLHADAIWNEAQPDELLDLLPAAPLLANRGAVCGVEQCVVGNPRFTIDDFIDQVVEPELELDAEVDFFATPGELWYVVASGGNGLAEVSVQCLTDADGGDTG